jgi:homoserine dehydrogenase
MRIIILGFGTVGQAVAEVLLTKAAFLSKNYQVSPRIVGVADHSGAAFNQEGLDSKLAVEVKRNTGAISSYPEFGRKKFSSLDLLDAVDGDIMIEATPTNINNGEPGLSNILRAMGAGMHVITSNKGPLALAFGHLVETAAKKHVQFRYGATVGGATPILSLAGRCLAGNEVLAIRGILNGTTNYILTKMSREGVEMNEALDEAQRLKIAETDPSYDIDGIDTACKIVILANAVMNRRVTFKDMKSIEGIREISLNEVVEAKNNGFAMKLIGSVDQHKLMVRPEQIPYSNPLCVDGTLNAVTFKTDLASDVTLIGKGAGPVETASTILNDLVDIVKVGGFAP